MFVIGERKDEINCMKKIIIYLLMIFLLANIRISVEAAEKETLENRVEEVALNWVDYMYPEYTVEVGAVYPVWVSYLESVEYVIDFFCEAEPYGYAVVCIEDGQAVVKEASIGCGTRGLYDELLGIVDDNILIGTEKNIIREYLIETNPMNYCLEVQMGDELKLFDEYGNIYEQKDKKVQSKIYESQNNLYISNDDWVVSKYKEEATSKVVLAKYANKKFIFGSSDAKLSTERYACAVLAGYNIAYLEGLVGKSLTTMKTEFVALWEKTKTVETLESKNDTNDNIIYGETDIDDAINGFVNYAKDKGKSKSYKWEQNNPAISWIRAQLRYNHPVFLSYEYNYYEEDKKKSGAHAIVVLGCVKATDVSANKTYDYIMVADGYGKKETYINYTTASFEWCRAACFVVK